MKDFQFTRQTVHNNREMKQDADQNLLAQIENEIAKAAGQIEKIEEAYRRAIESYTCKIESGSGRNICEMELEALHISAIERQRRRAYEILEEKKTAYERHCAKLVAPAPEAELTSRLREIQVLRCRLEPDKSGQNAVDEMFAAS